MFEALTAKDVMSPTPVCILHSASIASAINIFLENKFHALPVVQNGSCVGIITPFDILKYINVQHQAA